MCETLGVLRGSEEIYLFLPLAHAFALLIQLLSYDVGDTIAYFGGDPNQIVAELQETKPTYLPSVPRIFEKVYTLVMASQPEEAQAQMKAAAGLGVKVRDMVAHGQPVPPELQAKFDRPMRSSSRTCARSSAAASSTRSPAPRRSRPRSSSSSTGAAFRCSRATA